MLPRHINLPDLLVRLIDQHAQTDQSAGIDVL